MLIKLIQRIKKGTFYFLLVSFNILNVIISYSWIIYRYTKQQELFKIVCTDLESEKPDDTTEIKNERFKRVLENMQKVPNSYIILKKNYIL